jgi:hypothetical protein
MVTDSFRLVLPLRALMFAALSSVFCSGCVVPYVVPPLRVQGQAGMALGEIYQPEAAGGDAFSPVVMSPNVRIGAFPLGLSEELIDREYDLGIGYLHERLLLSQETGVSDRQIHGGFLEGHYWFYTDTDESHALRIGLVIDLDYLQELNDRNHTVGHGFGVFTGIGVEWVSAAEGLFMGADDGQSGGDAFIMGGFAKGEVGIGFVAGTSYRQIGSDPYWTFTVGLSLRLPAAAGLIVVFDD